MKSIYIKSQDKLDELVKLLRKQKIIFLDTEFTRRTTYYPILSIIQIAVHEGKKQSLYIIDCQSNINLKKFYKIIASPRIAKVLHSARQDIQIFYLESKLVPKNIVDTQIMANFCDFGFNIGYAGLVQKICNIEINKGQQNSNWKRRPLSKKQIEYALIDVVHLNRIFLKLQNTLKKQRKYSWFEQEMPLFIKEALQEDDKNLFKRFSFKQKTPQEKFILQKLILLREKYSRKYDVPRRHLIKDELLEDIAKTRNVKKISDKKLLKEIKKILNSKLGPLLLKTFAKETFVDKNIFNKSKNLLNKVAADKNIKSQLILSAADLKLVIGSKKIFKQKITGWRYDLLGTKLKNIINS